MAATALVLPVSGPYVAKWQTYSLGTQQDDGFTLTGQYTGQEVNASDAYGQTLVEAIWRGLNWRLRFRGLEMNRQGILAIMQAFGSTGQPTNTFTPTLANIGTRYSAFSQPLVLTSILPVQPQGSDFATSANPGYIGSLTALNANVAPQSNVEMMLTSKVREVPMEMVLMPYAATVASLAVNLSFTTT